MRAAMAAEAVGVAQRALELGVEHAKTREQFGKPIGMYQAVSHQLADTYADVELARSLAYWAAWCVAEEDANAPARRSRCESVRDRGCRRRRANAPSRCTAGSASPGSTRYTAITSAPSGSKASGSGRPSCAPRSRTRSSVPPVGV